MEIKNATNRSSEVWKGSKGSQSESEPSSMGTLSTSSSEYGSNQVRTGRENSEPGNTVVTGERSSEGITGKIISQLTTETEKQLAYHEQQAAILRDRLNELKELSEISTDINKHE